MICYINDQFTKFSTLFDIILINHITGAGRKLISHNQ